MLNVLLSVHQRRINVLRSIYLFKANMPLACCSGSRPKELRRLWMKEANPVPLHDVEHLPATSAAAAGADAASLGTHKKTAGTPPARCATHQVEDAAKAE